MKIFQVVPYYPPHSGGMEYYVQHLSEELAARGHEVTIFTSSQSNNQSICTRNGVRICSLKIMIKAYNVPIVPTLFSRLIDTEKPDVVHTHQYPVFFSDLAAVTCWIKKVPLIVHVHVVSDAKSALSGFISDMYYATLGLRTLQTAASVVAPSLAYKTMLEKMHVNQKKIQVIPYGIDAKKFQTANGNAFKSKYNLYTSKIILSVGRLNYQKGFQYLIQAMPAIIEKIPNVKLVIVGEGEQLSYLQQLTKKLGITEYVFFTGALSQTEIPDAYAACDVFVLPSLFESFGISLIEAQAAGKPVIGTKTGGTPEALVDGKTGFLVEPNNPQMLEAAVVRVLSNRDLSVAMGENGVQFAERFDIHAIVSNMIDSYKKLITCQG